MRVHQQSGFVLHTRPFSETSLLVDIFSRDHGRLTLLAKGARRLKSKYRGVLLSFSPLVLGWTGKGELPILTGAEQAGPIAMLGGAARLCGFYVNELIMRLLHKNDAHQRLFDDYEDLINALRTFGASQAALRVFEKRLLKELGYALDLEREANGGEAIEPEAFYQFVPAHGAVRHDAPGDKDVNGLNLIRGNTLLALAGETFADQQCLVESKRLMRSVLAHFLGGRPIHSRKLFKPFS